VLAVDCEVDEPKVSVATTNVILSFISALQLYLCVCNTHYVCNNLCAWCVLVCIMCVGQVAWNKTWWWWWWL